MSYIISTCTTIDMNKEMVEKLDIRCIGFHFVVNGKSYTDAVKLQSILPVLLSTCSPALFYAKKERSRASKDDSTLSRSSVNHFFFGLFLIEKAKMIMIWAGIPNKKSCHQLYCIAVR